jgi:hypothetical protein
MVRNNHSFKRTALLPAFCIFVLAVSNCTSSGRATCPARGHIVTGASCSGEDLQCPIDVNIAACDGTIQTRSSSCSCTSGTWQCPSPGEVICPEPEVSGGAGGIDSSGSAAGDAAASTGAAATMGGTSSASTSAAGGAKSTGMTRSGPPPGESSCPFIYAWNGSGFEYQTDIEGEVIGLLASAAVNRGMSLFHASHVKLPTAVFSPEQGIELHLRETIAEIAYFDKARLLLVDHPSDTEVWSNSGASTYEWNYVDPLRFYTTKAPTPPIAATDEAGNDVLSYLTELDDEPAPVDINGDHYYTLDFGPIVDRANVKLLIEGWAIYKIPSTENIQPHVEVETAPGIWEKVADFGVPAGDLKPIIVDLAGRIPDSAQRMRLHLGVWSPGRWVIDRIRLDQSPPADVRLTYVDAVSAELLHRGRATFVYSTLKNRISSIDDTNEDYETYYGYGYFTRYGDVLSLITEADDKMVIMRHGDQITVRYPGVAAAEPGYTRTVMLEADTFYKVFLDPNVLESVEPLPFHGMTKYPYSAPEAYPSDPEHNAYVETYNTRRLGS